MKKIILTIAIISVIFLGSEVGCMGSVCLGQTTTPSYADDFSTDSGLWTYAGNAYRDATNQSLVLTQATWDQGGVAFFKIPVTGQFTANFSYKAESESGGDGITMFFYKQQYTDIGKGGSLGFGTSEAYGVPGYGIEFDGWQNMGGSNAVPPAENPDPSASHVALIKDWVGTHLAYVDDSRVQDNKWHDVSVVVGDSYVGVFLDGEFILRWDGTLDRTYNLLGFSGGTGSAINWHIIDNFSLINTAADPPSEPTHTSHPYPVPPPPPAHISIAADTSTLTVGSAVDINGKLLGVNDSAIGANKTIIFSYSVDSGNSWYPVGSARTNQQSQYSIQWVPQASGIFSLKTEWSGDENYTGASNTTTLCLLPYEDQKVFCVESNSTITDLDFSSVNHTLAFAVSGPSGTTGYTKVAIAKSLVADATTITATVDGKTVNYTISEANSNWIMEFTYSHSTHQVSINLAGQEAEKEPTAAASNSEPTMWIAIIAATCVIAMLAVVAMKRCRGNKTN
jgi:hypothetical protein